MEMKACYMNSLNDMRVGKDKQQGTATIPHDACLHVSIAWGLSRDHPPRMQDMKGVVPAAVGRGASISCASRGIFSSYA